MQSAPSEIRIAPPLGSQCTPFSQSQTNARRLVRRGCASFLWSATKLCFLLAASPSHLCLSVSCENDDVFPEDVSHPNLERKIVFGVTHAAFLMDVSGGPLCIHCKAWAQPNWRVPSARSVFLWGSEINHCKVISFRVRGSLCAVSLSSTYITEELHFFLLLSRRDQ
jgi:hypothetical protein